MSTIDATVERSQSLTVRQQTATRASADEAPALPPNAATLGAKPDTTQSPKPLLAALLHADETPTVDPAKLAGKAPRFFEKLFEKLAERFDFGASQHQTVNQIAAQFLQRLSQGGSIEAPATADNGQVVQPEGLSAAPA